MSLRAKLFREEAIRHYNQPDAHSSMLELTPIWTRAASWILLAVFATIALALTVVRIHDYAQGPAFIRLASLEITSTAHGRVSRVDALPGMRVEEGDMLFVLAGDSERVQFETANAEFRRQLANVLLDPIDQLAQDSLVEARGRLDAARARLADRSVSSPTRGVITDVRVQIGDIVEIGTPAITIQPSSSATTVIALIPGHFRPMLHAGQSMRLELNGFPYAFQELHVTSVSDTLIGPSEARRYVGRALGDALDVRGPVVVVSARVEAADFLANGESYPFFSGMPGTARVRVRGRNGWLTIFPVLGHLFE